MSMPSEAEAERVREMLTFHQVLDAVPIERKALERLENDGLFPKGHFVSPRKKLWFRDEVVRWQRDLADPASELSKAVQAAKLQKTRGD
jgi:hypothetical protein